ncbi:MAG: hypothetical protein WKF71_17510 [Pyrinomonadaceae bacterium]
MFKSILASITIYSIVFFSIGQTANALPLANLSEDNRAEIKSCASCSTASANPLDRLATLGRRTQNIELLPIARSQLKGSPIEFISSSSGELAFAQADLAFKDNPLLLFQRNLRQQSRLKISDSDAAGHLHLTTALLSTITMRF